MIKKIYFNDLTKEKKVLTGLFDDVSKTFFKKVKKNHYMRICKGFGISDDVLCQLKELGCENISISGFANFESKLEDWFKKPAKNFSHGFQRFMGA